MPDEVGKEKRGFPGDPKLVAVKSCCLTPKLDHFPRLLAFLKRAKNEGKSETAPFHSLSCIDSSLKLLSPRECLTWKSVQMSGI